MRGPRGLDIRISDARSDALIVLVHGFTASKDDNFFPALFDRLSRCSVVALDLSAHGKSEGRFEELSFPDLEADIEAVIDRYANGRKVVLIGHSMGGSLAYRLAARRDDVSGIVLLAPGFEVRSSFLLGLRDQALENGSASFTDGFGEERTVSAAFFASREYDPLELATDVSVPALVICGELDYTVSNDACRAVAEAIGARFEVIEDVGHTFADSDAAIGPLIVSFLAPLTGDCF